MRIYLERMMGKIKITFYFFLLFTCIAVHGRSMSTNIKTCIGLTIGNHIAVQNVSIDNQTHHSASGTDLFGVAIDLKPRVGTEYYARLRFGVVPGNEPDSYRNLDPSALLFAGSKSIFRVGKSRVPFSVFSISSSDIKEQLFSIGSFHYIYRELELLPMLRLEIDLPFSISPFMRITMSEEESSLGYGVISTPSIGFVFHQFELGYDLHVGMAKAIGHQGSMTYAGWQLNLKWVMASLTKA